jgi:hypothetical protein
MPDANLQKSFDPLWGRLSACGGFSIRRFAFSGAALADES